MNEILNQTKNEPLVSIICATFNHELYIRNCLEGIFMQKTNFLFEIILHDDASTDNTTEITREFESKYPGFIKPIYQNVNQYSQGNFINLYPLAKGKYIALCEGDDYWTDPYKLQKQVDFMEQHSNYSMTFHNAIVNNLFDNTQTVFNKRLNKSTFGVKDIVLKSWFTPTASFLFRNENFTLPIWQNVNGDMIVLYVCATKGNIYYMDELMCVYNYGSPSSISLSTIKQPILLYKKKTKLLKYFDEYTNYRYVCYTYLKRIRMILGLLFRLIK